MPLWYLFCSPDLEDLGSWLPPMRGTGALTLHYNPPTKPVTARQRAVPSWDCRWG